MNDVAVLFVDYVGFCAVLLAAAGVVWVAGRVRDHVHASVEQIAPDPITTVRTSGYGFDLPLGSRDLVLPSGRHVTLQRLTGPDVSEDAADGFAHYVEWVRSLPEREKAR